jgi:hypothetical protein
MASNQGILEAFLSAEGVEIAVHGDHSTAM